ncbi:SapC family protein [Agaribacter marinus]|uniref:Peptidase n=1 Tax=Agaribacter marinus TaxID=1431249 RepID=A0AA37WJT7_9ALTE|nr:SapC family protein [Agaribacter marinus]GLR70609.1 peptidase [Agaribacter marinus]
MLAQTILSPNEHKDICVITTRGEKYGENVNTVPVIADELRSLVTEYPVCLLKDPNTGRFALHALTGFDAGENLFLEGDIWQASYVPLHILRQPFMIGIKDKEGAEPTPDNTVVTIQLEHKRVTDKGGEALFDKEGNATNYLNKTSELLAALLQGLPRTSSFVDALVKEELVEQMQLNVKLKNGEQKSFQGFYSINEDKLSELKGDVLEKFHSLGYLQACHMLIASFGNIQKLINKKNASL